MQQNFVTIPSHYENGVLMPPKVLSVMNDFVTIPSHHDNNGVFMCPKVVSVNSFIFNNK